MIMLTIENIKRNMSNANYPSLPNFGAVFTNIELLCFMFLRVSSIVENTKLLQ